MLSADLLFDILANWKSSFEVENEDASTLIGSSLTGSQHVTT